MGSCATKPLDAVHKAPVEIHEEYSSPRSAEVAPTSAETATIAEEVVKPSEAVEEKKFEEKPVEVSDSKPTTAPGEQKFDSVEKVPEEEPKTVEEKPVEVSDSKATTAPVEQKLDSAEKLPEEEPTKEKEALKPDEAEVNSKELKS